MCGCLVEGVVMAIFMGITFAKIRGTYHIGRTHVSNVTPRRALPDRIARHLDRHRMLLHWDILDFCALLATSVGIRAYLVPHGSVEGAGGGLVRTFQVEEDKCPRQ